MLHFSKAKIWMIAAVCALGVLLTLSRRDANIDGDWYALPSCLTQEDVATAVDQSKQSVSNWETGKRHPSPDVLDAIADALSINRVVPKRAAIKITARSSTTISFTARRTRSPSGPANMRSASPTRSWRRARASSTR